MRILQVSAEIFPLLKTGGLADVAGAMPHALQQAGCDVRVMLPGFAAIRAGLQDAVSVGRFQTAWGMVLEVVYGSLPALSHSGHNLGAYVVLSPELYDREGGPYDDLNRNPYPDNHRRFAALGWAAAHLAQGFDPLWRPQVVHSHDWHAALAPACLAFWDASVPRVPTVYTIHNLAYQGVFGHDRFADLGLPQQAYDMHGLEFFGQLSFMKAGLFYADRITTVSPTYALEIQTQEQGCGLDGLLRARSQQLRGILNGVDAEVWDPARDTSLPHRFDSLSVAGKALCKASLQSESGLEVNANKPLFAVVSRLTEQKGLPLVLAAIDEIVDHGGQLLVLGNGESALEQAFVQQAQAHAGQVAVRLGYDESFAHRIFAGSDVALVPSRFEPCGLTQMYAMKYGGLPLVRSVGGLADTVVDATPATMAGGTATGFVFDAFTQADYRKAVQRALALYTHPEQWSGVQQTAMAQNYDWTNPAKQYVALYRELIRSRQ